MKKLFYDYKDLLKHNWKFVKDHKVAVISVNLLVIAIECLYFTIQEKSIETDGATIYKKQEWTETYRSEA